MDLDLSISNASLSGGRRWWWWWCLVAAEGGGRDERLAVVIGGEGEVRRVAQGIF